MKAIVVYESLWGNTATIARAIAKGLGDDVQVMSTGEARTDVVAAVDLVIAGSPVLAFRMPSDAIRDGLRKDPGDAPLPPDLSHPPMRSWLKTLQISEGAAAAFDTQVRGPFGKAAPAISKGLRRAGYRIVAAPEPFYVSGRYGPLEEGETTRAMKWGEAMARELG